MDNEKFTSWLDLLAHWQYPRLDQKGFNPNGTYSRATIKKKVERELARLEQEQDTEDSEDLEDMPFVRDGRNTTLSPQILAIKREPRPCEDCGIIVQERVIEQKVYTTGGAHWRKRCSACNKVQNPDTGLYDIPAHRAHVFFKDKIGRRNK